MELLCVYVWDGSTCYPTVKWKMERPAPNFNRPTSRSTIENSISKTKGSCLLPIAHLLLTSSINEDFPPGGRDC